MPIEFPDGTTPVAKGICIYRGHSVDMPVLPDLPTNSTYFEEVLVMLGQELVFKKRNKVIRFKDTPQDVISEIGKPSKIFYKEHDKLRIHATDDEETAGASAGVDYVYNYFKLGLDVMFDGATHQVKKFILHTNFPGNKDFNKLDIYIYI
eukprot:GEZU01016092.1.p1 GENE.GEZU01016092.1~~GEZU01016092.1.p1  ORF type:complete len:150 (-),score=19.66 GEZU01016092.1:19-468(-)